MKREQLPPEGAASSWRLLYEHLCARNARIRSALSAPTRRTSGQYRGLLETSLQLTGIGLILELGEPTVRGHVADAVEGAEGWLESDTGAATSRPGMWRVDATIGPLGDASFEVARRAEATRPAGAKEGWHVVIFDTVLETLLAFGSPEGARRAATTREEWYRSNEVAVEEACFADLRAKKLWLLGDDENARTAASEVVKTGRDPIFRTSATALIALLDGTRDTFDSAIQDALKVHKRVFSRAPDRPESAFALRSLALCRMARSYGMEVEERPYLPVQLLPPDMLRKI